MKPTNREFELVYSQEEMELRIEQLKMHGYNENDIHVLARDKDVFDSYEGHSNVEKHEAESFSSKFKSFFSGDDTVETQLRGLDLDQSSIERYSEDIKKGAILLYTDGNAFNRERDNSSSFGDDSRTVDIDESKRNTALTPFGRDIERDGKNFNDEKIRDSDVRAEFGGEESRSGSDRPPARTIAQDSERIYTSEVRREDQHGERGGGDKAKDSRLDGENIHPTTGATPKDEGDLREKRFDHEPQIESDAQQDDLNREDGVNRRQDEQSPGVDPNLGPAPFGRDSEEERLIRDEFDGSERGVDDPKHNLDGHSEVDNRQNPRDARPFHEDVHKKTSQSPTPRLY
ncbi:general stress protein [Planococcus sp. CAU13]|uniref:general stress protein n=1 Tax=Planococcus sp. CAU13 TaxID=1541197 RepID=UPI00052FFA6B|nr:general stress protein [Planococcus sp. CAU13]